MSLLGLLGRPLRGPFWVPPDNLFGGNLFGAFVGHRPLGVSFGV